MTVQGVAAASATSVTMPAHAAGDLILIFARRNATLLPTVPTAGGTVPIWNVVFNGTAAAPVIVTAWARAEAANHTTGTWTNATQMCVLILRADTGKAVVYVNLANGNANATQTIVYPALTLSKLDGTSWGVRCGTRGTNDSEVANVPTGWTFRIVEPAAASAVIAIHTKASLVANPVSDSVATTGVNSNYRAHTIELNEQPVTQQPTAMIV